MRHALSSSFLGGAVLFACGLGAAPLGNVLAAESAAVLEQVRAMLQPWQPLEEAWVKDAAMIFRSTYGSARLPCIRFGDTWAMPKGAEFRVGKVVKGEVRYKSVIMEHPNEDGKRLPHALAEGRSYLVFLKPSKETLQRMQEHDANFVRLFRGIDEVVAIVDLSQSKAEADALAVTATRSGSLGNFEFTPAKWKAMRAAKAIDLKLQKEMLTFLTNVVLTDKATLASVRAYLGPPDYHYLSPEGYEYHYNFTKTDDPQDGQISASLEAAFRHDLSLARYRIEFSRCRIERGDGIHSIAWIILSPEEHNRLKLPLVSWNEKDE